MEDWMNLHRQGKLQSVSLGANPFNNRIRSKFLPIQLLAQALSCNIRCQELDFITDLELYTLVLSVIVLRLVILSILEELNELLRFRPRHHRAFVTKKRLATKLHRPEKMLKRLALPATTDDPYE